MQCRSRKRIVLGGAGHAHLHALKRTQEYTRRGYELVAIAPGAFWYSGLATGMLGGLYRPELDRVDVERLVVKGGGRFIRDEIVGLDVGNRTLILKAHRPFRFDILSLNLGSECPPIPGDTAETYRVKPIRRLWDLRKELEARFESDPERQVRVAIGGGGITAFETAANIAALARRRGGRAAIDLYIAGKQPLEQLPHSAARRLIATLQRRGLRIHCGARIENIAGPFLRLADGREAPFDIFLNATGLRPAPIMASLGLPTNEEGALIVDHHLMCPTAPGIFGGGDCIAFRGNSLPRIGVYAVRQGPVLHHNLLAALAGQPLRQFRPQSRFLFIIALGDGTGLAVRPPLWWHGRTAFLLKDWIDRRFLREWKPGLNAVHD